MKLSIPKTSGIKPGLVSTYDFSDQGFADPADARYSSKFVHLSRLACAVGDLFYIRSRRGVWEKVTKRDHAIIKVFQEHAGIVNLNDVPTSITQDDVKAFFGNAIVHFGGVTYAPLKGDFVWFNGERRLNLYSDARIAGDDDHIEHAEEFLRIVRNSLCGALDELDAAAMLEEAMSTEPTPFRWVMHWLAARYQRPGYTSQTNLWLVGGRGTGKGSLLSVLRLIFGAKGVGKIDASDIGRGWSTSLFGSDFIEWDEFKSTGWHDLNRFIKEKTGNESYSVTQRNVGDTLQPFVAGQIMTTNDKKDDDGRGR